MAAMRDQTGPTQPKTTKCHDDQLSPKSQRTSQRKIVPLYPNYNEWRDQQYAEGIDNPPRFVKGPKGGAGRERSDRRPEGGGDGVYERCRDQQRNHFLDAPEVYTLSGPARYYPSAGE
jgi:hypothetical protein